MKSPDVNHEPRSDLGTVSARMKLVCGEVMYKDVAAATGGNAETVRRYLNGCRPSVEFVARLADWRRVSTEWLVHGRGPMLRDEVIQLALEQAGPERLCRALGRCLEEMKMGRGKKKE